MVTVCHSSTLNSRLLDLNSTEQSQNVYENKGSPRKSTTPGPLLIQGGEFPGCPSSDEEGLGRWDFENRGNELEDLLETKDLVRI